MRVFVTGGTGLIGRHLAAELEAGGHSVVVLTRNAAAARDLLPATISLVEGDPNVRGPWQEAISSADAVVSLAGEPIFGRRWTKARKEMIRASRVNSTENVVEAMAHFAPGAKTLISGSGIGYYGFHEDEEICEGSAPGADFLAQVGVEWEAAACKAKEAGIRVVLLRTGVVLAREGGALKQMTLPFRLHLGGRIGSGSKWISWIHIEDLVGVIVFALDSEGVEGPINGTAPHPVTNREFAKVLGSVLGRKSWLPVPRIFLRIAMGQVADLAARGQRVLPQKALAAGYRFRYPDLFSALSQLLAQ